MSASVWKSDDDCRGSKSEEASTLFTVMFLHSNICFVRSLQRQNGQMLYLREFTGNGGGGGERCLAIGRRGGGGGHALIESWFYGLLNLLHVGIKR